jgi:hypothetical protein
VYDVDHSLVSPHLKGAKPELSARATALGHDAGSGRAGILSDVPDDRATSVRRSAKVHRLIAGQEYFGLEAQALRDGIDRTLARLSTPGPQPSRIDVHALGEDFRRDAAASWTLLRALLAAGLLLPDGPGCYRPSARFREYAVADIVAPLSRSQARGLVDQARKLAEGINADRMRYPFRIRMILVSGSYMSRSDRIPELSLWLLLRRRPEAQARRWRAPLSKSDALREIAAKMKALSSLVVVRLVADKSAVPRPFSVVFDTGDDDADSLHTWDRFRQWGASISRRLSVR